MKSMMATILAGGKGTRMDILCQIRPKPALPFAGKFRVIDFSLTNCIHSQISNVAVLVDYQRSYITSYLNRWQNDNSLKSKFDILEPGKNSSYSGTANALYQNLDYLRKQSADKVLILPSDQAYKMDYRKMLAFHEKSRADVTIAVISVPIEEAHRFGTLTIREDGYVTEYIEKPDMPKSNLVSMGIYIFNKDILIKRLVEDAVEPDSIHCLAYSITPGLIGRDAVYAYKYDGFWRDIGTVDAYYATSMELINAKAPFIFNGTWPVLNCENSEPVRQFPHSSIENSIISPGCVIKGRVENSILSPGVWVDEQATVRNSILLPKVFVGFHSLVDSCIADEEVNIGKYCYVGFGSDHKKMSECTLLGNGATISSHTAIARGCRIMPHTNPAEPVRQEFANDYLSMQSKSQNSDHLGINV
jgi:glucose-1-phosphate adenylyltransferase